jgi:hypothetical protein
MAKTGIYQPIDTVPGVQPSTDKTGFNTPHWTYSDKVRFNNGNPEKINGWLSYSFNYGKTVDGTIRTIYSDIITGKKVITLGTNTALYSVFGNELTNITPLKTTSEAVPNSLDTHYATLGNDPFAAVSGSATITVTDSEYDLFTPPDLITLSGATGFAGISAGALNGDHIVRAVGIGTYEINVGEVATSTTSGGGASVVRTSGLITVNATAHGMGDDDRIKIEDALDTGGILAAEINLEHNIRNIQTNSFDIFTDGTATSSVSSGGGANTIYYEQIDDGNLNQSVNQGYGAGLYGAGLYGTALTSTSSIAYPRIWFMDRYANTIITTPGNQSGLYQWDGVNTVAPELIANAPTQINYAFESDNIIVTFGASDMGTEVENRIFASDQNDITDWTSSSTNQVFDDDIEGAGRLISHSPVSDGNLIFTNTQTYTFRYIGLPFIWEINTLEENIGIIAPYARVSIKGVVYWMGNGNFYMYRGGNVEVIPANTQDESTCLEYVFEDINLGQSSKIHGWYNKDHSEVWFHYPSAGSNECDRVVVVNVLDKTWALHIMDRTASQEQGIIGKDPLLANVGTLYKHEVGDDDDASSMAFTLSTNKKYMGKDNIVLNNIIPDSIQTGDITFRYEALAFPQSTTAIQDVSNTLTPTTEFLPITAEARFYRFTISGDVLGQSWKMGTWLEEIQRGSSQ